LSLSDIPTSLILQFLEPKTKIIDGPAMRGGLMLSLPQNTTVALLCTDFEHI
jgi:hypothetical protein